MNFPILSTIIFLPLLGSIFIFLFNDPKKNNGAIYVSLFTSLSNFLLYQLAYSEMIFVDKFWPEFTKTDLIDCINTFSNRKRRYGK